MTIKNVRTNTYVRINVSFTAKQKPINRRTTVKRRRRSIKTSFTVGKELATSISVVYIPCRLRQPARCCLLQQQSRHVARNAPPIAFLAIAAMDAGLCDPSTHPSSHHRRPRSQPSINQQRCTQAQTNKTFRRFHLRKMSKTREKKIEHTRTHAHRVIQSSTINMIIIKFTSSSVCHILTGTINTHAPLSTSSPSPSSSLWSAGSGPG